MVITGYDDLCRALDGRLILVKSAHPDIAESYINIGTFEMLNKKNFAAAKDHFTKALDIFKVS